MSSVLSEAYFHDEQAAFAALEKIMWPSGKPEHCPHCGVVDRMGRLAPQRSKPSKKHPEGKFTVSGSAMRAASNSRFARERCSRKAA